MEEEIKIGDIVTVILTNDLINLFSKYSNIIEHCKVIHIPNDTGDSYCLKTQNDYIFTINPNCSEFLGLVKENYLKNK